MKPKNYIHPLLPEPRPHIRRNWLKWFNRNFTGMRTTSTITTRKKEMLQALAKTLGIVSTAARRIGIDRTTHYVWMNDDPEYKKAVEAIADLALDMAETSLHTQVKARNVIATIFYLKTKGKKRGYIEKNEIGFTDNEGRDIPIIFNPAPGCEPLKPE